MPLGYPSRKTYGVDKIRCYNAGMETEFEAKYLNIDKDEMRARLKGVGATLKRSEFPQRRWVFDLPKEKRSKHTYVRVRDEGGIMMMTWKRYPDDESDNPKEIEIEVSDFDKAVEILTELGCAPRSYQENRRELWHLDDAKITIDSWPFYEPFIEIEGTSEEMVRTATQKLGFEWSIKLSCSVSKLFQMKYGDRVFIREMPKLTFDMPNPFV